MLTTFGLTVLGWIVFRSDSIGAAWDYIARIFSPSLFSSYIGEYQAGKRGVLETVILIVIFICVEWIGRAYPYAIANLKIKQKGLRYLVYYLIVFAVIYWSGAGQKFIYFQF
jgi:hypothetical protein